MIVNAGTTLAPALVSRRVSLLNTSPVFSAARVYAVCDRDKVLATVVGLLSLSLLTVTAVRRVLTRVSCAGADITPFVVRGNKGGLHRNRYICATAHRPLVPFTARGLLFPDTNQPVNFLRVCPPLLDA